jgi:hypothetical protein
MLLMAVQQRKASQGRSLLGRWRACSAPGAWNKKQLRLYQSAKEYTLGVSSLRPPQGALSISAASGGSGGGMNEVPGVWRCCLKSRCWVSGSSKSTKHCHLIMPAVAARANLQAAPVTAAAVAHDMCLAFSAAVELQIKPSHTTQSHTNQPIAEACLHTISFRQHRRPTKRLP